MDLSSTFKAEVYRPVVTIVTPGGMTLLPFGLVLLQYSPKLKLLISEYQALFGIAFFLCTIIAGFLLENLGALIESKVWDRIQENPNELENEWFSYLRLAFSPEPIGHRYLRTITLRMKFELSFGLALIPFWVGSIWFNNLRGIITMRTLFCLSFIIIGLLIYLLWESYNSSKLLRKLRHEMLKGIIKQTTEK